MTGLVRQALRTYPWASIGPAAVQCLAATIVAGSLDANASMTTGIPAALRPALDDSGITHIATVFVTIAVYISIILIGLTMAATIARQSRDIALVRAVGAAPGQIRRAVALQAGVVAVPSALLGVGIGGYAGRAWIDALVRHGVLPPGVTFHPSAAALPAGLGIVVGTSLLGALIAAIRPSRVRPAVALTDTAVLRPRLRTLRTVIGLILVAGGVVLSFVVARESAAEAAGTSFFVMLSMCVGAGVLGPALMRTAAVVLRRFGGVAALAGDAMAARSRALSGALVPLTLAVAFATVQVALSATQAHVTGTPEPAGQIWTDNSGTTVYAAFAALAALNPLITATLTRRRDLAVIRLAGATRGRALAVVICEAVIVVVTGLTVGGVVAEVTLAPMLGTSLGTVVPYLPPAYVAIVLVGVVGIVGLGTVVPAGVLLRRAPIEAVAA